MFFSADEKLCTFFSMKIELILLAIRETINSRRTGRQVEYHHRTPRYNSTLMFGCFQMFGFEGFQRVH